MKTCNKKNKWKWKIDNKENKLKFLMLQWYSKNLCMIGKLSCFTTGIVFLTTVHFIYFLNTLFQTFKVPRAFTLNSYCWWICNHMVLSAALDQNSNVQSSLSPDFAFFSPPSVPERLRIQVSRIAMEDYESLNYDKDKLRAACKLPAFHGQCMMGWMATSC